MQSLIKLPVLKHQKWIIAILILISFGASLSNGYSFDDELVTTEMNSKVSKGLDGIYEILTTPYSSAFNDKDQFDYRPVAQITFALEKAFFGFKPSLSHLINLLLYIYICLLVFKILRKLLEKYDDWVPFFIVLIFSLHPLHSEVVVSLKNREELLVALFGFSALHASIFFLESKKIKYILYGIVFLVLGMNSKSTFIPFIYIIPFLLVFFEKIQIWKGFLFLIGISVICSLALFLPRSFIEVDLSREVLFLENPLNSLGFSERLPNAFYTFYTYLRLHLFPYPLLSYYGYAHLEVKSWSSLEPYLGLLFLGIFTILFFYFLKKNKLLSLGIGLFLLFLAPYQNFPFPVTGIVAERFAFGSVLAFSIIVIAIFELISSRFLAYSKKGMYTLFLFLAVFSFQNISRTKNWNSLISLLEVDVKNAEKSAKLQMMYGDALLVEINKVNDSGIKSKYLEDAILAYRKAIRIVPDYYGVHSNLGVAYSMKGAYPLALKSLQKGIDLGDKNPQNIYNLGACYELSKDTINAIKYYEIASKNHKLKSADERLDLLKSK